MLATAYIIDNSPSVRPFVCVFVHCISLYQGLGLQSAAEVTVFVSVCNQRAYIDTSNLADAADQLLMSPQLIELTCSTKLTCE